MACNGMFAAGSVQIDARMAPMAAGSLEAHCWLLLASYTCKTACYAVVKMPAGRPELAACKTLASKRDMQPSEYRSVR